MPEDSRTSRPKGIFFPESMVQPLPAKEKVVRKPRGRTTIIISGVLLAVIACAIGVAVLCWNEVGDPLLSLFSVHSSR